MNASGMVVINSTYNQTDKSKIYIRLLIKY